MTHPKIVRLHYRPTNSITYGVVYKDGVIFTRRTIEEARECVKTTPIEMIEELAARESSKTFLNSDFEVSPPLD
ncbi:hypothetical protein HCG51_33885 (plasmid) [Tolypothrix sp. PCC 7910]|uniref:hypothetical protein n=1 Tax=Tolypothrix sp. PCC 7910 TaxID=2099387 RepID=UPI0014279F9B|nr:hypothetical protein [Tolypothrix sp. PCC 7910]QIR41704.1 hypothetical protein HCG51_33885 [Tolypothrix sp. PCC 7910]